MLVFQPIELSGHSTPITSLTFSTRDLHSSLLLCTASQHVIILWDVEQAVRDANGKYLHTKSGLAMHNQSYSSVFRVIIYYRYNNALHCNSYYKTAIITILSYISWYSIALVSHDQTAVGKT